MKAEKRAVRAPERGAAKREPKKIKIPNSIQYLMEKAKLRLVFGLPGRYILSGKQGKIAVVRMREETRYNKSVLVRAFKSTASTYDLLDSDNYDIDSLSAQPGTRSNVADQKMGRKKRTPGMLAPGWWVFIQGKAKTTRHYVGPRISGRRLLGIVLPDTAPVKQTTRNLKLRTDISDLTSAQQTRYKRITLKGRQVNAEIKLLKASLEGLSARKAKPIQAKIDLLESQLGKLRSALTRYQKHIRTKKEANLKQTPAKQEKPVVADPVQAKINSDKKRIEELTEQMGKVKDTKRRSLIGKVVDQLKKRIGINVNRVKR